MVFKAFAIVTRILFTHFRQDFLIVFSATFEYFQRTKKPDSFEIGFLMHFAKSLLNFAIWTYHSRFS